MSMLADDPNLPCNGGALGDLLRAISKAVADQGYIIPEDRQPELVMQIRCQLPKGGYICVDVEIPMDLLALSADPAEFLKPHFESMRLGLKGMTT